MGKVNRERFACTIPENGRGRRRRRGREEDSERALNRYETGASMKPLTATNSLDLPITASPIVHYTECFFEKSGFITLTATETLRNLRNRDCC
jgi:hypothetical protein